MARFEVEEGGYIIIGIWHALCVMLSRQRRGDAASCGFSPRPV